jgi:hypothetical protein
MEHLQIAALVRCICLGRRTAVLPKLLTVRSVIAWTVKSSFQSRIFIFILIFGAGVKPSPLLLRPFIGLLYQSWMANVDECGAISGMNVRGNRRTRRKPVPVPHCLPEIPYESARVRTTAAAMQSRRLTA